MCDIYVTVTYLQLIRYNIIATLDSPQILMCDICATDSHMPSFGDFCERYRITPAGSGPVQKILTD